MLPLTLRELRTLVAVLITEDERALQKWAVGGGDPIDAILAQIGIIPVPRGNSETSHFASGAYNDVREVVYQGKRAIARSSGEEEELDQLQKLVSLKDRMDEKYAKHFPVVYTTFEVALPNKQPIYGAVVEMLDDLPPALKHDIRFLKDTDTISRARAQRASHLDAFDPLLKTLLPKDAEEAKAILEKIVFPFMQEDVIGLTGEEALRVLKNRMKNAKPLLSYKILLRAKKVLVHEVLPIEDDSGVEAKRVALHPSTKLNEFYAFLRKLSTDFKFRWSDMHLANFMIRPSTGDFVIVDPGLFGKE